VEPDLLLIAIKQELFAEEQKGNYANLQMKKKSIPNP